MPEIFLIECSAPHWLDVSEQLSRENVRVTYWTGWYRIGDEVRQRFPLAIFHDTLHAKRALAADGSSRPAGRFDQACATVWRDDAALVYDMMNRFDHSRDQSFVERSTLFYDHLIYWQGVLDRYSPDLVVFSTPPHVVYDYVLLALCRYMKIKTVMFEEATIRPPYCLEMSDYRVGSLALASAARQKHAITEETWKIIKTLRGDYRDAKPAREVAAHKAMAAAISEGLDGLRKKARIVADLERTHAGKYDSNEKIVNTSSLYKEKGIPLRDSFMGSYANTRFMEQRIREQAITDELREMYHSHAISPDTLNVPFIYIALAGQPERTSNPQAELHANQLLMVNQIANSAPEGWQVAVREHPNQFHPEFAVNMCRDKEFYRAIMINPHVCLLPTDHDPFEIIDRASAVATTGGTSALEAVARGKPAILFGDSWYRDCPGVYRIRTIEDLDSFWERLASGETLTDINSFANFVEAITVGCFKGLGDYPPDDWPVSKDENVGNLFSVVLRALK